MILQNLLVNGKYACTLNYETTDNPERFIIENGKDAYLDLLVFPVKNDNACYVEKESGRDYYYLNAIDWKEKEPTRYELTLIFESKNKNPQNNNGGHNRGAQTDNQLPQIDNLLHTWKLKNTNRQLDANEVITIATNGIKKNTPTRIDVTCKLDGREARICLFIGQKENIADVVLDFGSEASQMAIFPRGETMTIKHIVNLFDEIKNHRYPNEENKAFVQYADDNKLFRSIFYIKKEIPNAENKAYDNPYKLLTASNDDDKLFVAFAKYDEVQKDEFKKNYFISPNVKLSTYGGIELPKIKHTYNNTTEYIEITEFNDRLFYRSNILLFLLHALNKVANSFTWKNATFISFKVLMPNVYDQQEIARTLELLQDDIQSALDSGNYSRIKGFELTAVSESDASLLGVFCLLNSMGERPKAGNYLILDAGKGTLDFSLLKIEDNNDIRTYKNIWRSGIIGAGNSLTYGYLLAMLRQFLEETCINLPASTDQRMKEFLWRNILGCGNDDEQVTGAGDMANLANMMNSIEKYKKSKFYKKGNKNIQKATETADDWSRLQITTFTKWIEKAIINKRPLAYYAEYVEAIIQSLTNEVLESIQGMQKGHTNDIDFVVFAGRAFKMEDFKNMMMKKLKEANEGKNITERCYDDKKLANPMKAICLFGGSIINEGSYSRKIIAVPLLIKQESAPASPQADNAASEKEQSYINILKSVGKKINIFSVHNDDETSYNLKNDGYKMNVTQECTHFNLGGRIYPIPSRVSGEIRVFFDGTNYIICKDGHTMSLSGGVDLRIPEFLFSSFFPNVSPNSMDKIDTFQNLLSSENNPKEEGKDGNIVGEKDKEMKTDPNAGNTPQKPQRHNNAHAQYNKELEDLLA